MSITEPVLEIKGVDLFFGASQILFDVSLQVRAGEIVTLLGANGAGKTSTIQTVSGVYAPRRGEVFYLGRSLRSMAPHRRVAAGIVQVPEGRLLFTDMRVEENLILGSYAKHTRKTRDQRMEWVYELFPRLKERRHQLVSTMSGGEQQMLAVGRGLMADPKLLLLDEPSIGLSPLLVEQLFSAIAAIHRHGVAILLVEQNAIQALQLASRGYVLENGHITHASGAAALLSDPTIKNAYLGL